MTIALPTTTSTAATATVTEPAAALTPEGRRIVVGVDGSAESKGALRWAARQAQTTGAHLHVITTWEIPSFAYAGAGIPYPGNLDLKSGSRRALERTITETLGDHIGLDVTQTVVEGHPAIVLLEAAVGADLLVIGSRGHGAFAGMVLGSVSEHCVAHASCPVVVIPPNSSPA
jgi:nucleotide-binding universal stress UspA family protein